MRGIHRVENDGACTRCRQPRDELDSVPDGHNFGNSVGEFVNKLVWCVRSANCDRTAERSGRADRSNHIATPTSNRRAVLVTSVAAIHIYSETTEICRGQNGSTQMRLRIPKTPRQRHRCRRDQERNFNRPHRLHRIVSEGECRLQVPVVSGQSNGRIRGDTPKIVQESCILREAEQRPTLRSNASPRSAERQRARKVSSPGDRSIELGPIGRIAFAIPKAMLKKFRRVATANTKVVIFKLCNMQMDLGPLSSREEGRTALAVHHRIHKVPKAIVIVEPTRQGSVVARTVERQTSCHSVPKKPAEIRGEP